jgi:hypothetical protein
MLRQNRVAHVLVVALQLWRLTTFLFIELRNFSIDLLRNMTMKLVVCQLKRFFCQKEIFICQLECKKLVCQKKRFVCQKKIFVCHLKCHPLLNIWRLDHKSCFWTISQFNNGYLYERRTSTQKILALTWHMNHLDWFSFPCVMILCFGLKIMTHLLNNSKLIDSYI